MAAVLDLKIRPLGVIGVEVQGIDLAHVRPREIESIKKAWYQYDVLVFRRQKMTDDDLLSFSKHFGTLDPPPNQGAGRKSPPGYPDIYVVSNVRDDKGEPIGALGDGEAVWHTDMSYAPHPPDASMLYSLEIPATGGDTCFASMAGRVARRCRSRWSKACASLDIKHDGTYDSGGNVRKGLQASDDPAPRGDAAPGHHRASDVWRCGHYLGRRRNAYLIGLELEASERLLDEVSFVRGDLGVPAQMGAGRPRALGQPHHHASRDAFDPNARRVMHRTQIKGSSAPKRATKV